MPTRGFFAEAMMLLPAVFLLASADAPAQTRRDIGSTRSSGTREASPPASSPRDDGRNAKPAAPSPAPSPPLVSVPAPVLIPGQTGGVTVDAPIPPMIPVVAPSPGLSDHVPSPIREVELSDRYKFPDYAGYDFSEEEVVPFSAGSVDMYFEFVEGQFRMYVSSDTDIQDLGPATSVRENLRGSEEGWSVTHSAALQAGHQYIVWQWDGTRSRFFVKDVWSGGVLLDWMPLPASSRFARGGPVFPK